MDIGAQAIAVGVTTDEIDRIVHEVRIFLTGTTETHLGFYNFNKNLISK